MSTQTTLKERFIDYFDGREGYPSDMNPDEVNTPPEDTVVSDDDTVMYLRPGVEQWGIMEFPDYSPNEGWSMGYAEWDNETHSVYVFQTGSSWSTAKQLVIQADKLEAVADFLDRTPAEVADDVECHRTYPAKIDTDDSGTVVIAPVGNATEVELDD